jgi:hypothetical protein
MIFLSKEDLAEREEIAPGFFMGQKVPCFEVKICPL